MSPHLRGHQTCKGQRSAQDTQSSKGPESPLPHTKPLLSKRTYFLWAVSSPANLLKHTGEVVMLTNRGSAGPALSVSGRS